jgi:hypothetical protein
MLITNDPELLKRMSAARSSYTRSDWYLAFRLMVGIDNVSTMLDDKEHTKRRAQMHNGVSNQSLKSDLWLISCTVLGQREYYSRTHYRSEHRQLFGPHPDEIRVQGARYPADGLG